MNALITIKAHQRAINLYKVLLGLNSQNGIENYDISISNDLVDPIVAQQNIEAIELAGIKCTFHFHNKRQGCAGNTQFLLEQTFDHNNYDYMFHLEDDTLPSYNWLQYCETVAPLLDNQFFAACTFHRPCHQLEKPTKQEYNKLVSRNFFDPTGGFVMSKAQWNRIKELGGMWGVSWISEKGRGPNCSGNEWLKEVKIDAAGSFGWSFDRYFREEKPCLYPKLGVVKNIGKIGHYMKDANLHKEMHENNNWHGNTQETISGFDTSYIETDTKEYLEDKIYVAD